MISLMHASCARGSKLRLKVDGITEINKVKLAVGHDHQEVYLINYDVRIHSLNVKVVNA